MLTRSIVVAANFTVEPLRRPLELWCGLLSLDLPVVFAPPDQIFQQLLDEDRPMRRNGGGFNVIVLRPDPWIDELDPEARSLKSKLDDLTAALAGACGSHAAHYLLCLAPLQEPVSPRVGEILTEWRERAGSLPSVQVIDGEAVVRSYEVAQPFDVYAEELANIPYSAAFFAALSAAVMRRVRAAVEPPAKVLAVDCDNTLWGGVCGEDGWSGLRFEAGHARLQELLAERRRAGVLVCLASKNNAEDVEAVFERWPGFPLSLGDVAASRVNWRPKEENLLDLSRELGLSLDSFVFLDDDPRECEEIRARLSEVVTLQCPVDPGDLPRFVEHLWACDQPFSTAEDRARTELYRHEARRREEIAGLASPRELLERLELAVAIAPAAPADHERIAQLTQRTTQLNASGVKRTPAELRDVLARGELQGLAVRVRDRFGDYGLVGAVLFRAGGGTVTAETFLLSCRALGRHVEDAMLVELARRGRDLGCARLEIPVVETARNVPLREFCAALAAVLESAVGPGAAEVAPGAFSCSVDAVLRLARDRETPSGTVVLTGRSPQGLPADGPSRPVVPEGAGRPSHSEIFQRIATELSTAEGILAALGGVQAGPEGSWPGTPERDLDVVARVTAIWTGILRAGGFGPDDDFFDLGGDSLGAVEVLLEIHRQLGVDIPMTILFSDRFTVNRLRDVIENGALEDRGLLDWDATVPF